MSAAELPTDWTLGEPRLIVSRCADCGHRWYLRRDACPACGSPNIDGLVAGGVGVVAAATNVHRVAAGAVHPPGPIGVALIDLDEGVRVMGRCAAGTPVGASVRVRFITCGGDDEDSSLIPYFEADKS